MDTIARKIDEVERARASALAQERARQSAESEFARKIEQADAELARLKITQAESQFAEAADRVTALVAENHAALDALVTELTAVAGELQARVATIDRDLKGTFDAAWSTANAALATIHQAIDIPAQSGRAFTTPGGGDHQHMLRMQSASRATLNRADRFPVALPLWVALVEFIDAAPDSENRKIRQAVAYALSGTIHNPQGADRDAMAREVRKSMLPIVPR